MRTRPSSRQLDEEASINLTPLIDVVFVVLIIFILIAPMLQVDRIRLASGVQTEEKEKAVQENSPICIHVRADNSIWLNARAVNKEQLLEMLKEAHQRFPHKVPQLFNDKKAYFEAYQNVKNAVELAGFEELDVILQPG
jgi:biopolymer transport protein ExbD